MADAPNLIVPGVDPTTHTFADRQLMVQIAEKVGQDLGLREALFAAAGPGTDLAAALDAQVLKNQVAGAPTAVDFRTASAKKRGVPSAYASAISEPARFQRSAAGDLLLQRGTQNLYPNPTFAGAVPGVIGSGGAWPTGWVITTSASGTLTFEVVSVTPDNMRVKVTRAANATGITNFGFRSSAAPGVTVPAPTRGGYATSATVGIVSATPNVRRLRLAQAIYNPPSTTVVGEPGALLLPTEGTQRLSVWRTVTGGQGVLMSLTVELNGTVTDAIEAVIDIGRPQIEDAASAVDVTEFVSNTRPAGSAVLWVLPGAYSILLMGPRGHLWSDVTVSDQNGWAFPPVAGSLAVSSAYAFAPLSVEDKDRITEIVAPPQFVTFANTTNTVVFGGQNYRTFFPDTRYGATLATNKRDRIRFEVRGGERAVSDIEAGRTNGRSELYRIGPDQPREMPFEVPVWTSYAMLIEDEPLERAFHILGQWHGTEDAADGAMSPLLHLNLTPTGEMQVVTRSYPNATTASASDGVTTIPYRDPDYPLGVWVRWVYQVRFSKTGNGFLQVWRDGVEVVNRAIPVGSNDALGPYWQFGAYLGPSDTNRFAVQYANVETGTASLQSRVSAPLPI